MRLTKYDSDILRPGSCASTDRKNRRGFTLVELLVVIGILGLLLAILLPALARVRESGRSVTCLSNLRQLSTALEGFLKDNRDCFPFESPRSPAQLNKTDWVWWRASSVHSADVKRSALAPYVGPSNFASILRCPSDEGIRTNAIYGDPPYIYSYTMNIFLAGYLSGYTKTANMAEVRNPSTKMLFAEEDERSLNDGGFWHAIPPKTGNDWLAIRHDYGRVNPDTFQAENMSRRGNVSFCDGHAESVDRNFASDINNFDPTR